MATTYADEVAGLALTPKEKALGGVQGARMARFRATIQLAAQADADVINLAFPRDNLNFAYGIMTTDTSLGSATVEIGASVDNDDIVYRADALFTATDTPEVFADMTGLEAAALSEQQFITLTVGTAALPGTGTMVVDLYFSKA